MSFGDKFDTYVIDRAERKARRGVDHFGLTAVALFLGADRLNTISTKVASRLGEAGISAHIYVTQGDIGNGIQDIGLPKVRVTARDGKPTKPPKPQQRHRDTWDVTIASNY